MAGFNPNVPGNPPAMQRRGFAPKPSPFAAKQTAAAFEVVPALEQASEASLAVLLGVGDDFSVEELRQIKEKAIAFYRSYNGFPLASLEEAIKAWKKTNSYQDQILELEREQVQVDVDPEKIWANAQAIASLLAEYAEKGDARAQELLYAILEEESEPPEEEVSAYDQVVVVEEEVVEEEQPLLWAVSRPKLEDNAQAIAAFLRDKGELGLLQAISKEKEVAGKKQ